MAEMVEAVHLSPADPTDLDAILSLLIEASLPERGLAEVLGRCIVARSGHEVVGAVAMELHGRFGLLRSLVVQPSFRGTGLGQLLVSELLAPVMFDTYLLTETAAPFFVRFGFESVSREEAPVEIRQSEEFRSLCPESAAFMRRSV